MEVRVQSKIIAVSDHGKVLLLRRSEDDFRRPNQWDIPGGGVEKREPSEMAAVREMVEETGIDLVVSDLILGYAMTEIARDGLSVTWLYFIAHVGHPEVTLSSEHSEYIWTEIEDAISKIEYDRQKRALRYIAENNLLSVSK